MSGLRLEIGLGDETTKGEGVLFILAKEEVTQHTHAHTRNDTLRHLFEPLFALVDGRDIERDRERERERDRETERDTERQREKTERERRQTERDKDRDLHILVLALLPIYRGKRLGQLLEGGGIE
jgi:hypothetical protein